MSILKRVVGLALLGVIGVGVVGCGSKNANKAQDKANNKNIVYQQNHC